MRRCARSVWRSERAKTTEKSLVAASPLVKWIEWPVSLPQNFARTPKCRVDVRTDIIETDPVYEAGMKQHFHRLRLHTAEEELGAFAMKFLQRDFERV